MAYQNVGTPRFYVNVYEYLDAIGAISIPDSRRYLRTNPTETNIQKSPDGTDNTDGDNDTTILTDCPIAWEDLAGDKGFVALLGHNMASCNAQVMLQEGNPDYSGMSSTEVVNCAKVEGHPSPEYDGFTIWTGDFSSFDQLGGSERTMQFRWESGQNWGEPDPNPYNGIDLKCNSIVIGNYYDMPHSPDLSLKLSYEYDGVKTQQTKGGATLSNALYTKAPDWGSMGCWQLGDEPNYRSGRRSWDLSFSYLSDSDVFPANAISNQDYSSIYTNSQMQNVFGYDADDIAADGAFNSNILTGTDFFSQVWNKTMGGHLPFIFQPNKDVKLADEFAICRFDMNSLQITQQSPFLYQISLKIRESW